MYSGTTRDGGAIFALPGGHTVTRRAARAARRSPVRLLGLLVCTLLLGLVGMHGLGPVPATAVTGHDTTVTATHAGLKASTPDACDHESGGCGGHAAHADPTCASASVAGPPMLAPALLPDVIHGVGTPGARPCARADGPDGGRAPPSLAELQLLRI
ncbi:DUF6153 family protein [Streptomyces sp. NPDC058001]|uniref:DUF6153 family protein n=1 Tax=Streptomyces sp. NPDC058001 TaxID=3346300 RepID=UPI0036EA9347